MLPLFLQPGPAPRGQRAPRLGRGAAVQRGLPGLDPRPGGGEKPHPLPALRLRVPEETIAFTDLHYGPQEQYLPTGCGDFILRRSDGVYAYQLAVVADDGAMGVNQVVRGRDLLSSTPRQILLYRLLGYPVPEFGHTPLLLASDGRRLSKRDGDQSLSGILSRGYSPRDVVGGLAYLGGLLPEPAPAWPEELLPLFSWEKLPREDIPLPAGLFGL